MSIAYSYSGIEANCTPADWPVQQWRVCGLMNISFVLIRNGISQVKNWYVKAGDTKLKVRIKWQIDT